MAPVAPKRKRGRPSKPKRGRPSGAGKKKTANESIIENENSEGSESEVFEKKKRGRPLGSGRSTDSVGKNKNTYVRKTSPAKRKRGRPSGTGKNKKEKSNDNEQRNKAMREDLGSEGVDNESKSSEGSEYEKESSEASEYEPSEDEVDQKKKRGRRSGSGKKTKVRSPAEEAGYLFWLSEHPSCHTEDWVANTAPTTWNSLTSYKKNKWIENSKLDPSVWSALREEKEKKAKAREEKQAAKKKPKVRSPEEETGYQFWLTEHPWYHTEDWVTNTAPTTWNIMSSYKKNKWIENSKLDPSVWSALREEKEKKAKAREEKQTTSYKGPDKRHKPPGSGRRPGSGKLYHLGKAIKIKSPEEAAERAAGYKLWLATDPMCQDAAWVARSAATTWNTMTRVKKMRWIERALPDLNTTRQAKKAEDEKRKAEGYQLWLASEPKCNDEEWVDRCAPTKWSTMSQDKKKIWIDKAPDGV